MFVRKGKRIAYDCHENSRSEESSETSFAPRIQVQTHSMTHEISVDKAVIVAGILGCRCFSGNFGDQSAPIWLEELEQVGRSVGWTDEQKLEIAENLLSDNVRAWWEGEERRSIYALFWNDFKEKFLERYHTSFHHTQEMRQFMALEQGDKSVKQYLRLLYETAKSKGSMREEPEVRVACEKNLKSYVVNSYVD